MNLYCQNCGSQLEPNVQACTNCGVTLVSSEQQNQHAPQQTIVIDKPNTVVNILSLCCFPILGIILYFVWKQSQPVAAKSALTFGLIGFGIIVFFYAIIFTFGVWGSMASY